jgi:hypothetical protein
MKEDDFLKYQQAMGLFYFGRYITDPRPQPGIPTLPDIDPSPDPPTPEPQQIFYLFHLIDLITGEDFKLGGMPSPSYIDKGGEMITSPKQLDLVPIQGVEIIDLS